MEKHTKLIFRIILTCFVSCSILSCCTGVNARATKRIQFGESKIDYILMEDFKTDSVGSPPSGWTINNKGGVVTVEQITTRSGEAKNGLKLLDNANAGESDYTGVEIIKDFESEAQKCSFEISFKFEATNTPICAFEIMLGQGTDNAARVIIWSASGILSYWDNAKSYTIAANTLVKSGVWYKVRLNIDTVTKKTDILVQSDDLVGYTGKLAEGAVLDRESGTLLIKGLNLYDTFMGDTINRVAISTSRYEGIYYIDYLNVEENPKELVLKVNANARPDPIEAPRVPDPIPQPSDEYININYNGEFLYFSAKPVLKNNRLLVPIRSLFEMFGMNVEWNEKTQTVFCTSGNKTIKMTVNSKYAYVGDERVTLDTSMELINGRVFAPLRFVAEALGKNVDWDDSTETVYLTD